MPCAVTVAMAAPAQPMSRTMINSRSIAMLSIVETTRKMKGVRLSPTALRTADIRL